MRHHAIFVAIVGVSTCAAGAALARGGEHHGGSAHGAGAHGGLGQSGSGGQAANRVVGQPAANAAGIAPQGKAGPGVAPGPQSADAGSPGDAGVRSRERRNNANSYGNGMAGGGYGGYGGYGTGGGYGGYGGLDGPADFGAAAPPFVPAAAGICPPGGGARSLDLAREDKAPIYKTNGGTYGLTCTTLLRSCPLPSAFFLGESCSCSVPGGRSGGHITP